MSQGNDNDALRTKYWTELLNHFFEKHPDGFRVKVFMPFGQVTGAIRRGPVAGTYQVLNPTTNNKEQKLEFDTIYFTADMIMAMNVVEETPRIVPASFDDIVKGAGKRQ